MSVCCIGTALRKLTHTVRTREESAGRRCSDVEARAMALQQVWTVEERDALGLVVYPYDREGARVPLPTLVCSGANRMIIGEATGVRMLSAGDAAALLELDRTSNVYVRARATLGAEARLYDAVTASVHRLTARAAARWARRALGRRGSIDCVSLWCGAFDALLQGVVDTGGARLMAAAELDDGRRRVVAVARQPSVLVAEVGELTRRGDVRARLVLASPPCSPFCGLRRVGRGER